LHLSLALDNYVRASVVRPALTSLAGVAMKTQICACILAALLAAGGAIISQPLGCAHPAWSGTGVSGYEPD